MMSKRTKFWLLTAAALVSVGAILFGGVMTVLKWDFTKLSTTKHETNTYEITEVFTGISVDTDTANVIFKVSADGKSKVECFEESKGKHMVSVQDGILTISNKPEKAWYDHIGINFTAPKITITLPQAELESLTLKLSTGKVLLEKLNVGDLDISVNTGKVILTDIVCKSLTSTGNTGDIDLKNVVAAETFSITRTTGDISFDSCDAAQITATTNTGDIEGSLLTDKVFIAQTSTGDIELPDTSTGGTCKLRTNTGDIEITIK